jgi:hypothetical protein
MSMHRGFDRGSRVPLPVDCDRACDLLDGTGRVSPLAEHRF